MKVFLLIIFLISVSNFSDNNRMTKVEVLDNHSEAPTTLNLSPDKETYFYFEYGKEYATTTYYYILADSDSISPLEACSTNTTPINWTSCQGCSGSLAKEHSKSKDNKYEFYEHYVACSNYKYIIVKYPPSSLSKLEVKVSYQDFYKKKEDEDFSGVAKFAIGFIIVVFIVIPCIALAIIIGIIVCCCICLRKKKIQGTVGYTQPYAAPVPSNPITYPMITQSSVNDENLLYSKPS